MKFYQSRILTGTSFEEVKQKVADCLQTEGFGVLSEIDIKATLKKKLDKDILPHLILGACNPVFADRALEAEPNISVMLPCNVTIKQLAGGEIEVATIDPVASMGAVQNSILQEVAHEVQVRLKRVLDSL